MNKQALKQNNLTEEPARFLEKIVIDVGVGKISSQQNFSTEGARLPVGQGSPPDGRAGASGGEGKKSILTQIMSDVALICGQKPQIRPAKKSVAGFKVREGQVVGLRATIRGRRMVDFFNRLVRMVLPRVRDFSGIKLSAVDRGGVLNIGVKEQYVFPEIVPEQSPHVFSLGISVVPRARRREEAVEKYRELGVPLKK